MRPSKQLGIAIGLLAILIFPGLLILIQSQIIGEMRQEKESLHAEIKRLEELRNSAKVAASLLAKANTTKSHQSEPSQELLRLRGQVGMLRIQLQEAREFRWVLLSRSFDDLRETTERMMAMSRIPAIGSLN